MEGPRIEGNFGYVGTGLTSEATSCPPTRDESRGIGTDYKGHHLRYRGTPEVRWVLRSVYSSGPRNP